MNHKKTLLVSRCLVGDAVRYDGAHKANGIVLNQLSRLFELRPICPEVGIGLPVPRPPIQLVQTERGVRVLDKKTHTQDFTEQLSQFAKAQDLSDVCGVVLQENSPSCGLKNVKVLPVNQFADRYFTGQGVFARTLQEKYPTLPMIEARSLEDTKKLNAFIDVVQSHA